MKSLEERGLWTAIQNNRIKSCNEVLMRVKISRVLWFHSVKKHSIAPILASINSFDSFHRRNVSSIYWITMFRWAAWSNVFESGRFHSILNKTKSKIFSTAILLILVRVSIHVIILQRQNKHTVGTIERCSFQRYQIYWYSIVGWGDMVRLGKNCLFFFDMR